MRARSTIEFHNPRDWSPAFRRVGWRMAQVLLLHLCMGNSGIAVELGIVRVVAQPEGQGQAQFTATHLGRGVMLTCGHCCRYAGGAGAAVTVQILRERKPYRSVRGRVVGYDNAADVGVLQLDDPQSLETAYALAPSSFEVAIGRPVLLYGWNRELQELHSVRSVITAVNLFDGPANLVTRAHPHAGDSGAPLVDLQTGMVIGVTTGADAMDRFGVHCGTAPIHQLLTHHGITFRAIQPVSALSPE